MNPRRYRLALVLAGVLAGLLTLLSWTQLWFTLTLDGGQQLDVSGQAAAPALSSLALAGLALSAALSIAGRVLRVVLGVVGVGIGGLTILAAATAISDPVAASARTVSDATALGGAATIDALVLELTATGWPLLALAGGALASITGLLVVVTARRWPGPTRKYETTTDAATSGDGGGSAGAWDALSGGSDPTAGYNSPRPNNETEHDR